jgi:tetratricopeptide (TPR) repeat protein
VIRRSKHLLVVLTAASAVVASIDCFGWLGWQSVSGTLAVNSEAGALRLNTTTGVYFPSFIERSRRLSVRDLGTASREVVTVALGRLGSRQVFWFGANAVGFTNLALQSLLRDQSDEALGYLGQGLSRDPTSPHLHRLRALVLAAHGDLDGALQDLAIAEALAPGYRSPRMELTAENERWVRLQGLRLRRSYYPRQGTRIALDLARELKRDGDEVAAHEVLAEFRDHPEIRLELANWAVQNGDYLGALTILAEITDRRGYPRNVRSRAWSQAAVARELAGDPEGASRAAEAALDLDPRSPAPYITLAGLAQNRGDAEAALAHLRKAWGMAPADIGLLLQIAAVAERAEKPADALLALGRAVELQPESPQIIARLVALQLRNGRYTEAAVTLSGALDRFPTDPELLRLAERLRRDVGIR